MKKNFKDILAHKIFELHHWQCFTNLFPICSYAEQTFWDVQWQFRLRASVCSSEHPKLRKSALSQAIRWPFIQRHHHEVASQESPEVIFLTIFFFFCEAHNSMKADFLAKNFLFYFIFFAQRRLWTEAKKSLSFNSIIGSQSWHLLIGNSWANQANLLKTTPPL